MKILLPTAKEMNIDLPAREMLILTGLPLAIVKSLSSLSDDVLAKHYKLKTEQTSLEAKRWAAIHSTTALAYPAWELFDGLMYRQMKRQELTEKEQDYLTQHAFITSALYGVINVFDFISPHRLDFLMGFHVNGQSLKSLWRQSFDEAVAEDELLISLLSNEFETVFSKAVQDKMIKLVFMEEKTEQLKVHSTISKKARGKCLNALVSHQAKTLEELKCLSFDGFSYREDLSENNQLVFVK